jgi:hypothetical protein
MIGLVTGTYAIASMVSTSDPTDYQRYVLHIPPGSASAPTVMQSATPRTAILDLAKAPAPIAALDRILATLGISRSTVSS